MNATQGTHGQSGFPGHTRPTAGLSPVNQVSHGNSHSHSHHHG